MAFLLDSLLEWAELKFFKGKRVLRSKLEAIHKVHQRISNIGNMPPIIKNLLKRYNIQVKYPGKDLVQDYLKALNNTQIAQLNKDIKKYIKKPDIQTILRKNVKKTVKTHLDEKRTEVEIKNFEEASNINVIVDLRSSWVSSGIWIPLLKQANGRWYGLFRWDTKTKPGKFYTTPNFSEAQWIDITTNWISPGVIGQPGGHGAGSYLWEYDMLRAAGYNPSGVAKRMEKRIAKAKTTKNLTRGLASLKTLKTLKTRI